MPSLWTLLGIVSVDERQPGKTCPKCKKRKAKRLLGVGAGLIFKGTGFYETDYKNKVEAIKKEGSSDSDSGSSDSSKSSDSGKSF